MHEIISLGKIDYNQSGRRNCEVTLEIKLIDGNLSICGNIWNPRKTHIYSDGQNYSEIEKFFQNNLNVLRLVEIWKRWHLNDMRAASPAQRIFLKKKYGNEGHWTYEQLIQSLKDAGLYWDYSYLIDGHPYEYGSKWLKEEIPSEVIADIEQIVLELSK